VAARLYRFLPRRPCDGRREPGSARTGPLALGLHAGAAGGLGALVPGFWLLGDPQGPGAAVLTLVGLALTLWLLQRARGLIRVERCELADLEAADETLGALLGATGDGVILCDPQLRIRLFNPAAEILFGRLSDETLAVPVQRLIPGLGSPADLLPCPGEDPGGTRVRHLTGVRGSGDELPLRLLLRDLRLDGACWLLILAEDLTERERAEAQLEYLAHHDLLTGLNNRRAFERLLGTAAADPSRARVPHALCLIDLDHFRVVKSRCGHGAGDKLLKQIAQIVSTKLAEATATARLGGDELAALFVGDAAVGAESACEELVRTVRSFLFTWQERAYDVTLSVGLVAFEPAEGVLAALGRAEIACQVAKSQGGDRLHVYSPGDSVGIHHHGETGLLATIGRALDQGRFRILAQPILSLKSGDEPLHYEILVRMQDDQGNPVSPDRFIPAAERYVLMPAVDRWILTHLLSTQGERLRDWHARYPDRFLFAVNLSATTLMDDSFLPYLKRQFADYEVPYPSICFEITETAAVSDLGRARGFIQDLKDLGCAFAVDDFGSGFASYAYLKSLPVRYLKIDGSFVRSLDRDPVDRAFVESINHIGHVLGLETIAEWAETPALIEALRAMGVDYAQGYGVGEAVALEDLCLAGGEGALAEAPTAGVQFAGEEYLSANERK
jgi:diguanylate cyclase (GGDEF)-like protein